MIEPNLDSTCQIRISKYAMLRRRATALLCASSLMLQQACYNVVPVTGAATMPAGIVQITVNERGRILLGNRLGSLLERVDGRIVRADSVNIEVAVQTSQDVRGSLARWDGDRVTIAREGISSIVEKKPARRRTAILTGIILGGIAIGLAALIGLKDRSGVGTDPTIPPPI
jgi:hypothetical protein